jgi:hypothetical protein
VPPHNWALLADINNDGTVNYFDLSYLTDAWLVIENEQLTDFNRDGIVNFADFALLADEWLKETSWH